MTIGAFSIILDPQKRVLLCRRRDKNLWNLPGGHVEIGEAPWDAALREAQEEIGVSIVIEKLAGVFFKTAEDDMVFQFIAHIATGTPTTSTEAAEVGYFSVEGLPQNTAPHQRDRIRLYFDNPLLVRLEHQ